MPSFLLQMLQKIITCYQFFNLKFVEIIRTSEWIALWYNTQLLILVSSVSIQPPAAQCFEETGEKII